MTTLTINPVSLEGFGIDPSLDDERLVLRLSGTGDMAAVRHLERCLKDVHAEVIKLGLRTVDIDIKALYLLNSSCLKGLVSFVYMIQSEGPRYEVRFITDPHLSWQPRSLRVIERLAPDIVSILES
jgi:hypothetical protein